MCKICAYNNGDLNDLTELNIKRCQNVTEIPSLPNLEILYCTGANITEIPSLPKLKLLDCRRAMITEIPLLPILRELYCSRTNITEIPLLPKLNYINCSNTRIIKVPTCDHIVANYCPFLLEENVQKIIKIQQWVRRIITTRKITYIKNQLIPIY